MSEPHVPELLYLTSDPCAVPLVMPAWARQMPELAAMIDAGYELHRRGHGIAEAQRMAITCACQPIDTGYSDHEGSR